ncbi:endospore germination permease [Neobacillus sp. D3-1R]|uniref:endospore germination permease n=1 Tax=Neobacillus sp. D3-1R TaxID=3445778 RepID=UPI003F9F43EA
MNKTRAKEVVFLFILSTGLLNHVIIIPALLEAAGRDAWMSVVCVIFPYTLYLFLIFYISKNIKNKNLLTWLKDKYGNFTLLLFYVPIILILFSNTYITLVDTSIWAKTYFLPETPFLIILLLFILSCFWLSTRTFKQLTLLATLVLPIVVFLGFFIMSVNFKHKNWEYLFPLFLNGYKPMIKGTLYSFSGLIEIFFVLLVQNHLESAYKMKHIVLLGLILVGLTLGPLSASIMEFGPVVSSNLGYPAYEEWKLLQLGDFISRMDFLAMFQWLSGALFRISLFMYMISNFINKKNRAKVLSILYLFLLFVALIPISGYQLRWILYNYFLPISLVTIFSLSIILFFLVLIKNRKDHSQNAEEMEP